MMVFGHYDDWSSYEVNCSHNVWPNENWVSKAHWYCLSWLITDIWEEAYLHFLSIKYWCINCVTTLIVPGRGVT